MVSEVAWGDGTGDKIYLTYSASEGSQTVAVSSDANTGAARSKVVTFSAAGVTPVSLTISQDMGITPGTNYLVYGSPSISNGIMTPDQNDIGFIYCNKPFNPGDGIPWTIQTKIKMKSYVTYRDLFSTVEQDGTSVRSIEVQSTNSNSGRNYKSYLSNNGTSWNIRSGVTSGNLPQLNETWYKIQYVCTYSSNRYYFKAGYPDEDSWTTSTYSSSHPTYGKYISFGGGLSRGINAEFDLSETKIWVNGVLWWEAISSSQ